MSMGTLCFANPNPGGYDISQYAYYGEYNNIWAFIEKDTYSSMYAHCDSSSVDDMINYVRENGPKIIVCRAPSICSYIID